MVMTGTLVFLIHLWQALVMGSIPIVAGLNRNCPVTVLVVAYILLIFQEGTVMDRAGN